MPFFDPAHFASLLIISAFSLWAAGALAAIAFGNDADDKVFSTVFGAGSAAMLIGVLVAWHLVSQRNDLLWVASQPIFFGLAPFANRLDPLASIFLALLSIVGVAVSLFAPGYLVELQARIGNRINKGIFWFCFLLFQLSMAEAILSANALTFIVFMELLSFACMVLISGEPAKQQAPRAALLYLGASRVATAFTIGSFLWLHYETGSWMFNEWNLGSTPVWPLLLAFVGFAINAGSFPFHIWGPGAHEDAPAPVSALMSGIMVNVPIYAMLRLFVMQGTDSLVLGYLALAVGIASALWGVLFALMEHDLKRLLAYSTVENIGLLIAGIGATVLCKATGHQVVSLFLLSGTIFHMFNHGLFKSLLFLGAGAVETQTRTRDLGSLGGLARNMPWTTTSFFTGSLAICALPPLNGFASKWLLYQGFFQLSFQSDSMPDRAIALAVVGTLSVIGALSLAAFAKSVGIGFLGRARSQSAYHARECSRGMVAAQFTLALLCVWFGIWVGPMLHQLGAICLQGLNFPLNPERLFTIPQMSLCLIGLATVALIHIAVFGSSPCTRESITWDCGYGDLTARAEETGSSFSQPIARIFSSLLQYRLQTEIKGRDRRHFPEMIQVEVQMLPFLENLFYKPGIAGLHWLAKGLVRIQTGSIHIHLLYVFMTLLILLCVGVSL
jgi:hydrogenase-4 component B